MSELERRCDRIVQTMGGQIVRFSSPRKAQICDIPDRRYRLRGVAFWAEIKGPKDKLTRGQLAFLLHEYNCNQIVFAGDDRDLLAMLQMPSIYEPPEPRPAVTFRSWQSEGFSYVQAITARGFRGERKSAAA